MNQYYKQVPKEKTQPLSFVAAVKEYGDYWHLGCPANVRHVVERNGPDFSDAIAMSLMERGHIPRVRWISEVL